MSYDGMYGELSTRGTANNILNAVLQAQAEVEQMQDEIEITAGEVAQDAQQAADSAAAALASETAAGVSAGSASSDAASATLSASDANAAAIAANSSEVNSLASANLAQQWAVNPEDAPVTGGEFSSFHWAQKAEEAAEGVIAITGPRLASIALAVMAVNDILIADSTSTMMAFTTGAFGRTMLTQATNTSARTALGLGTAAVENITTSDQDTTAGRLTKVGDFGLGNSTGSPVVTIANLNSNSVANGIYTTIIGGGGANGLPAGTFAVWTNKIAGGTSCAQIAILNTSAQMYFRSDTSVNFILVPPSDNPTFTGQTKTSFMFAGNGTPNANSRPADPQHWFEVTNNPGDDVSTGNQLMRVNSYGGAGFGGNFHWCRYRGTEASPTAVLAGNTFMSFGFRGWNGTELSQSAASFAAVSNENWTPTANGIRFEFQNVADGGIARTTSLTIDGGRVVSARNMGVGTDPAPWTSVYRALDLGVKGTAIRGQTSTGEITVSSNIYFDGSNRYSIASQAGAAYQQSSGNHTFNYGVGGAANSVATLIEICRFRPAATTGFNAAATAMTINRDTTTSRSINAAGTVNASGADYAEYMKKASTCGTVLKGQVVGINSEGHVTDQWYEAVTFMVKSTDPSYVGGDVWGSKEVIGDYPADLSPEVTEEEQEIYKAALEDFEARLEAERQKYDRIAFSGQVPVNIYGASAGDYIVPIEDAGSISAVNISSPTFEQYMQAVGKVIAIEVDGRARILVKPV